MPIGNPTPSKPMSGNRCPGQHPSHAPSSDALASLEIVTAQNTKAKGTNELMRTDRAQEREVMTAGGRKPGSRFLFRIRFARCISARTKLSKRMSLITSLPIEAI